MRPLDNYIKDQLDSHIVDIGRQLDADTMSIVSPLVPPIDATVRNAIEVKQQKKSKITIVLETPGGIVEIVERMVGVIRNFYQEVMVIVPNQAMSAGTVFALSADKIMMDYFSRLGPIDPQIFKDGKLVPALSYLKQYEKLNKKAQDGNLTTTEYAMLEQLDIGELYQFEQARELSMELLIEWLSQYKFKDWTTTETQGLEVTSEMKQERAEEIARLLNDTDRWHSHGRGIDIFTLRGELKLKIDDYEEQEKLNKSIRDYFSLLLDYLNREKLHLFVHTEEYF